MIPINFANCAHGGERDKKTRFLCSHDWLQSMALPCPKNHIHKPFTIQKTSTGWQFDTAKEGEYPKLLCEQYSQCILKHKTPSINPVSKASRVPGNTQQTKRHLQNSSLNTIELFMPTIPPSGEHKMLLPSKGGENGAKAKYSIYHTPEQFFRLAKTLTHPFDIEHRVPGVLRSNIHDVLCGGVQQLVDACVNQSKRLTQLRHELRFEEARLQSSLPPHARVVLEGKSLVLFQHLLREQYIVS